MKCILLILNLLIQDTTTLNKENLQYQLKQQNIQFKNVVYAQALLESNSFKSKLCRKYHNLFGMSYPIKRTTIAKRHKRYAKYDTWIESVKDYKLFQLYVIKDTSITEKQYIRYLSKNYAKDRQYKHNIEKIMISAEEARNKNSSDTAKEVAKKLTALDLKIKERLSSSSKLTYVNIEIKDSILEAFKVNVTEAGYTISEQRDSRYDKNIKVLTINW